MRELKSQYDSGQILVIAEIGINHNGEYQTAKELILKAAESGCHAIKFQYRNLNRSHGAIYEIGDDIISSEIKRNFLSPRVILGLSKFAQNLNLYSGISFFCIEDLDDFKYDLQSFDFFKVPSVEHQNTHLISTLCEVDPNKLVLVATGTSTEKTLYESFTKLVFKNWVPLHCISNYPVAVFNSQIGYIRNLIFNWNRGCGYSSHDSNWAMCILAISEGATIIERHITLSKELPGLDHTSSSTPDEFKLLCEIAKNYQQITRIQSGRFHNQGEMLNLQNLGRSLYANQDILEGDKFVLDQFQYRSPRTGLTPYDSEEFLGLTFQRPVKAGQVLTRSHFKKSSDFSEDLRRFANDFIISLPVRFHDFDQIRNWFQIENYEFHLSYQELLGDFPSFTQVRNLKFTIHLPDYCCSTSLIDPFAEDKEIRKLSLGIIEKGFEFANRFSEQTGNLVNLVGSFSAYKGSVSKFYSEFSSFIQDLNRGGPNLSLQWLPPIAWYFGGSVPLSVMNDLRAKKEIISHQIPIVMDTSHLFLGSEFHNFSAGEFVSDLASLTSWYHISAASGIDGEGGEFTSLNQIQRKLTREILATPKSKVIEVWQGHLNNFEGFESAISDLRHLEISKDLN